MKPPTARSTCCVFRLERIAFVILAVLLVGCSDSTNRSNSDLDVPTRVTLKVLVIEDRELGEAAQRRWQAEGLGELQLAYQSAAEFRQSEFSISADVDVLIYPEKFQADLLHRQLLLEIPWETWNSEQVNKSDLLTHFRGSLMRQGDRYFALPLGGVNVVLMYRRDVLDALGTIPPTTWDELDQLLERLTEADLPLDLNGQSLPRSIALPLAEEWAGHLLLARAAASVRSAGKLSALFQVETMEPLIHTTPFIEALDGLRRMARHQLSEGAIHSPRDVFAAMLQGRAALGIGWPTGGVEDLNSVQAENIRIARLPGSHRVFDQSRTAWNNRAAHETHHVDYLGIETRAVSVLRNSLYATESLKFAAWLCSKRTSQQISVFSVAHGPFRASQLSDISRWTGEVLPPIAADEFGQVIQVAHQSKLILTFPRIVGQSDYLAALADSVHSCLRDEQTAEVALGVAAERWRGLTTRIGHRVQRDFLRRGEGF